MVTANAERHALVLAPSRILPSLRLLLAGFPAIELEPLLGAPGPRLARARRLRPMRPIVAVASRDVEILDLLAAGADEVVLDPVSAEALQRAILLARARAESRELQALDARLLGQVLTGLGHALEGPLAALTLDLDALRSCCAPAAGEGSPFLASDDRAFLADNDAALADCTSAVDQVARAVRDAALLADPGGCDPPAVTDPAGLAERIVAGLGGPSTLGAHVEVQEERDLPMVMAPRRALLRTLAELVVAALDDVPASASTKAAGADLRRLRIALRAMPDAVAVAVEVRPALDAPAPTARSDRPEASAAGGLRDAFRAFDAELVTERTSGGTVSYVAFLPAAHDAPNPRPLEIPPARIKGARPKVLVVDRDARVLRSSVRALGDQYAVVVAASGEEALAVAREEELDAALIDVRLPDVSAEVLSDELRRLAPRLVGRIAFISGEPADPTQPGPPVVRKPIRRTTLLDLLGAMLTGDHGFTAVSVRLLN